MRSATVAIPSSRSISFTIRIVAHNTELAPVVPVAVGDTVEVRGEYEWNQLGGVIHWTHRDPDGRHAPGWIRLRGRLYQ